MAELVTLQREAVPHETLTSIEGAPHHEVEGEWVSPDELAFPQGSTRHAIGEVADLDGDGDDDLRVTSRATRH